MSISNLLVSNNFGIASSGGDIAEGLYSSNNANIISIASAADPTAGQALIATGPNGATWQNVVTPTSINTVFNKNLIDSSNAVAAESLWSGSKTNLVTVSGASNPTTGQVLTATGPNGASWQDIGIPASGSFGDVNVEFAGSTILSLDLTGVNNTIGVRVTTCVNVGGIGTTYDVYATFTRLNPSQVQLVGASSTVNRGGDLGGEAPEWQHDTGNIVKLVKTGAASTTWGGNWSYSSSSI